MTRPDLDLLLSLCDEFSAPATTKLADMEILGRWLDALSPDAVRSLVQDAKIGRLARVLMAAEDQHAVDCAMQAIEAALHSEEVTRGK